MRCTRNEMVLKDRNLTNVLNGDKAAEVESNELHLLALL